MGGKERRREVGKRRIKCDRPVKVNRAELSGQRGSGYSLKSLLWSVAFWGN